MTSATDNEPGDPRGRPTPSAEERKAAWRRGLFMLAFILFFAVAETLLTVIALAQFLSLLITGERLSSLARFGAALGLWMAEVARYQAGVVEERPFPWSDWPTPEEPVDGR